MNFMEIANTRQSCRSYDPDRPVEQEKLQAILEAGLLRLPVTDSPIISPFVPVKRQNW